MDLDYVKIAMRQASATTELTQAGLLSDIERQLKEKIRETADGTTFSEDEVESIICVLLCEMAVKAAYHSMIKTAPEHRVTAAGAFLINNLRVKLADYPG